MMGYIAIVRPHCEEGYECAFTDLDLANRRGPTADDALDRAQAALNRHARAVRRKGGTLPEPRAAADMIRESELREAVAAACLTPRGA